MALRSQDGENILSGSSRKKKNKTKQKNTTTQYTMVKSLS